MEGFDAGLADSSGFAEGFTAGALGFPATTGTGFEGACADAVADADADADTGTLATGAALWLTVGVATALGSAWVAVIIGGAFFAVVVLDTVLVVAGVPFCAGPRPIPRATTPAATATRATMTPIIFELFFFGASGSARTARELAASLRASEGSGVA